MEQWNGQTVEINRPDKKDHGRRGKVEKAEDMCGQVWIHVRVDGWQGAFCRIYTVSELIVLQ